MPTKRLGFLRHECGARMERRAGGIYVCTACRGRVEVGDDTTALLTQDRDKPTRHGETKYGFRAGDQPFRR